MAGQFYVSAIIVNSLLVAGTPYEEDDREADMIYDQVDEFMDSRHKRRRYDKLMSLVYLHSFLVVLVCEQRGSNA